MTDPDRILKSIQDCQEQLKAEFRLRSLGVFGSWARGDASPDSAVDILVEFEQPTFDGYMDLKYRLEALLARPVDLVTKGSLKPALKDRVLGEVRYVSSVILPQAARALSATPRYPGRPPGSSCRGGHGG